MTVEEVVEVLEEAKEKLKVYAEALWFYADSETHKRNPPLGGDQKHIDPAPIEIDEGQKAREALGIENHNS